MSGSNRHFQAAKRTHESLAAQGYSSDDQLKIATIAVQVRDMVKVVSDGDKTKAFHLVRGVAAVLADFVNTSQQMTNTDMG
jgi:hypothetical protein